MSTDADEPQHLRLSRLVRRVTELPPYSVGRGSSGLPTTDRSSFCDARCALILAAVQLAPLLEGACPSLGLPASLTSIDALIEADPRRDLIGDAHSSFALGEGSSLRLVFAVRSATTLKLLTPQEARKGWLRALAGRAAGVGSSWEAATAWAARAEAEYAPGGALHGHVPNTVAGLKQMWLLPEDPHADFAAALEAHTGGAGGIGGIGGGGSGGGGALTTGTSPPPSSPFRRGDRLADATATGADISLWWPPPEATMPYELANARAIARRADAADAAKDDRRARAAAAAEARARGAGAGAGGR